MSYVGNSRTPATVNTSALRGPEEINSERIVSDMSKRLVMYRPNAHPFVTFVSKTRKKREAFNAEIKWAERDILPRELVLTANSASGDTTLNVAAGDEARVAANYVLLNTRTRESVLVSSTASGVITVVRGWGSQTQVDMVTGDKLQFLAPAYEDGVGLGSPRSIIDDNKFNYLQIIRTPFGFTGRDEVQELYGRRDPAEERVWQAIEHARSIERAMFFGRRATRTVTHNQTFMGGLEFYINTNVWDISGLTFTEDDFNSYLEVAMREGRGGFLEGEGNKVLYISSRWASQFDKWGRDKVEYESNETTLGVRIGRYRSSHGFVNFVHAPTLDEGHASWAFLVDMNHVQYAFMRGRDTKLLRNRQENDIDGSEHEYFSDVGLVVELEDAHGILTGLGEV